MTHISLDSVVANINRLPSLPSIVNELIAALGDAGVNVEALAHGIEKDQALTARALRVANSPFYGMRQRIVSIHDAIVVLGFRAVSSLVTTAALTELFKSPQFDWFDQSSFWRQSLGSAISSRQLARKIGMDPEIAFTAGLLHDIGRLVLVICYPDQYRATLAWRDEQDCFMVEAERHVLGVTHNQAGEALARYWNLGSQIRNAAAYHHTPPAETTANIIDLIHVADVLAHALDVARAPQALVPGLDPGAWRRLGLDWEQMSTILPAIENEFESYDGLQI